VKFAFPVLLRKQEPSAASEPPAALGSCVRSSPDARRGDGGFSLIEAMVALAVLAVAAVGLTRAVESHIDSTRGLERRAIAMWVAENRMAEITIHDAAITQGEVEMLGQNWRIKVDETRTDDPDIHKLRITVFQGGDRAPLASLDGFVDGRPG
jgi:general secretion pathway protein I